MAAIERTTTDRGRPLVGAILTWGGIEALRALVPLFGPARTLDAVLRAGAIVAASSLGAIVAAWVLDVTACTLALGDRLVTALAARAERSIPAPDPRESAPPMPPPPPVSPEVLRGRLDAARAANDAEGVLELRAALAGAVPAEALRPLDQELARWFLGLIQKRLRGGRMSAEVAGLAGRVAEQFGATPEGASLRAALPTLRRSAGLCARCAEPYTGIADACPKCLAGTVPPALDDAAEPPDDDTLERQGEPLDDLFQSSEPLDPL